MNKNNIITVKYENEFEVVFKVENDEETNTTLHEINNFWSNSKIRLSNNDNDIQKTTCVVVAKEIMKLQSTSSFYCSVDSVIKAFEEGIEGFYPIDGSYGLKLIDIGIEFDVSSLDLDVSIKEEN